MKYLFSYLVIMIIPLLIMGLISYKYLLGFYTQEVLERNMDSLVRMKSTIDLQVTQMNSIALQAGSYKELVPPSVSGNPLSFFDVCEKLAGIKHSNGFIHDIVYYYKGAKLLYSYSSTHSPEYFVKMISDTEMFPEKEPEVFIEDLQTPGWKSGESYFLSGNKDRRLAIYTAPIIRYSGIKDSFLFFIIPMDSFEKLVKSTYKQTTTLIMDQTGTVIYLSDMSKSDLTPDLSELLSQSNDDYSLKLDIAGKEHFVYFTISETTGLTYVSFIPVDDAMVKVTRLKNLFLGGFGLILLFGTTAIYLSMKFNYNPLRQLGQIASNIMGEAPKGLNYIDTAKAALMNLSESRNILVAESKNSIRVRMLLHLLKGGYGSIEEFNAEGSKIGLAFSGPYFTVIIFSMNPGDEPAQPNDKTILVQIEEYLRVSYEVQSIENLEANSYVFIISTESYEQDELQSKLQMLWMRLEKETGQVFSIYAGNPCKGTQDIYNSYIQAKTASNYRLVKANDKIIFYRDLNTTDFKDYVYPRSELEALYNAILEGNTPKIEFIIEDLARIIKTQTRSLFLAVSLCYDVINTVFKAMHSLSGSISSFWEKRPDLSSRTAFNSIDELIAIVKELCAEVIRYMEDTNKTHAMNPMREVIDYITLNFNQPTFSVQSIADHFNISISNLSHQFKRSTGINISDYINDIRIDRAKELLRTTDLTINEIIEQIGYMQTSSFIRRFRQVEGKTPGAYRSMFK